MNTTSIKNTAKHVVRVSKRAIHKHGPMVASVLSTFATVGGTVWACKKTLEVQPVVEAYKLERSMLEDKKEIRKSYLSEAGFLAKEYAGPAATLVGGEALKYGAVHSMKRTIGELTLGIAALQTQVNDLKKDIYGKMGDEKADKLTRGIVDEEDPNDETCEPNIYQPRIKGLSPYAVIFDENHPWWKEDPLYRKHNFEQVMATINDALVMRNSNERKPVVLVNELYEHLHYKDTELGSHAGWRYDPRNHPEVDNKIEFIFIDPITGKRITEFPNGIDRPVYIDFNVDYGFVTQFMEVC